VELDVVELGGGEVVVVGAAWHTVMATDELLGTIVPPGGFWLTTLPDWFGLHELLTPTEAVRPAPCRLAVAAAWL
jgi:hypothetical protein